MISSGIGFRQKKIFLAKLLFYLFFGFLRFFDLARLKLEVTVGIEPTNNGFANRAISHSGTSPQFVTVPL